MSADLKEIEIHALSDWHIGDSMSDFKLIQQTLEYIKNTPNAFVMLNGDLMDTAISSSVGDTYGANLQPMEQLKTCVKLFEPIKDKILCILPGNHENRVYKTDGIDMTALMAAQLGLSERYTDTTALLFVRFGHNDKGRKMCYSIYSTHGCRGGRKEGGKINALADLACIVDSDVYVHSHTHLPAVFKNSFYRANPQNNAVALVDKLFVNTASALQYGGYGDKCGYKPSCTDNPVIILDGKRKKMRAIL
ncbi:MAG TPA: metallophosphoesterase [Clostridia bacterium]|nr:metallophosphoesterase [Clostridia bacterium]